MTLALVVSPEAQVQIEVIVIHSTVHAIAVWGSVKKRGPKLVKRDA